MNSIKLAIGARSKPTVSPFANGIEKFKPKLNSNTDLGDFTIYFDNEKKYYIKAHQLVLEKGNVECFGNMRLIFFVQHRSITLVCSAQE